VFAKRVECGQGSHFRFTQYENDSRRINFTYATFWNDFSHYSIYEEGQKAQIDYRVQKLLAESKEDNLVFESKESYIDYPNELIASVSINKEEKALNPTYTEILTLKP
jgi:hypothetical protein